VIFAFCLRTRLIIWVPHVLSALAVSLLLEHLGVPAALLIGPLMAGAAAGLAGARLRYPRWALSAAQAVTGVLVATSLRADTIETVQRIWPLALGLLLIVMASAIAAGVVTGRLARIEREAAIWGFLPGMASAVIAMSDDRGLDARVVAVIQMVRIVVVIFLTAGLVGVFGSQPAAGMTQTEPSGDVFLLVALVALGPVADRFLRVIPAAALLVPLTVGSVLDLSGLSIYLPQAVLVCAYLVIGANVGLGFDRAFLSDAARSLPVVLAAACALYAVGALLSLVLAIVGGVDPLTALLSTVPGSIDAIAAIAFSEGADISVVMTLQIMRLFVVILVGPVMARLAVRWVMRRTPHPPQP